MRSAIFILLAASLVLCPFAFAKNNTPGPLPAPENFDARVRSGHLFFSWDPVRGAEKYSVDVSAKVTYFNAATDMRETIWMDMSFGTSDRTDGEPIDTPWLAIPGRRVLRRVLAAIEDTGVDRDDVEAFKIEGEAKVKALAPHRAKGRQNNAFSDPDDFEYIWTRPAP